MKTYILKLKTTDTTEYNLYDGTTLVSDTDLGTLFTTAGEAYFVFDFNSLTPSSTTALTILDSNSTAVITNTGLTGIAENKNFKGAWSASATAFDSFVELTGVAMDEAQLGTLVKMIKNAGEVKILTTADYNYPTNNPTSVGLWLLDEGIYYAPDGVSIKRTSSIQGWTEATYVINRGGTNTAIMTIGNSGIYHESVNGTSGAQVKAQSVLVKQSEIINNLTSSDTDRPLSANQGKVLKDLVDSLVIKNAGAPTTSTVGTVGQLLEDTTNGDLYICTDATNPYVWEEVGGGASGATLLTTADYNYPADNPTTIDPRLLPMGLYYFASDVSILNKNAVSPYSLDYAHWMYVADRYTSNNTEWTRWFIGPSSRGASSSGFLSMAAETGGSYTWDPYYNADIIEGLIFADSGAKSDSSRTKIRIGKTSSATGSNAVAIGGNSTAGGGGGTAIGTYTSASGASSIAIGRGASATAQGQFDISVNGTGVYNATGYNDSNYRLITGVYDGQSDHDAVNLSQLNGRVLQNAGAPTTTTVGTVGQLLEDITNGELYQCTAVDTESDPAVYTWEEVGDGPTVVQTTGTSTADVMSQAATSKTLFSGRYLNGWNGIVRISPNTPNGQFGSGVISAVGIGANVNVGGNNGTAVGTNASAASEASVALGYGATASAQGQFDISTGSYTTTGYNSSNYRLLTGLYDPQSDHDAATKGYVDTQVSAIGAGTRRATANGWDTSSPLDYISAQENQSGARAGMFYAGKSLSDYPVYVGIGIDADDTTDDPYMLVAQTSDDGTGTLSSVRSVALAKKSYVDGLVGDIETALNTINNGSES